MSARDRIVLDWLCAFVALSFMAAVQAPIGFLVAGMALYWLCAERLEGEIIEQEIRKILKGG